jgi:CspA family cold shock protein
MAMGTVKVWSRSGGYGWIKPDGSGDPVYVHKSGVVRQDPDRAAALEPGQRVEYQLGSRPKGPAAVNVRVVAPAPGEAVEATG